MKKRTTIFATTLGLLAPVLFGVSLRASERSTKPLMLAAALDGKAYDVMIGKDRPRLVEVPMSFPVLSYFGRSADQKLLAYVALDALDKHAPRQRRPVPAANRGSVTLVPSGDLYVEQISSTHKARRINPDDYYVIAAAWSPSDANLLAYTFSTGEEFGVAIKNISTGTERVLRTGDIVAEYIAWDDAGNEVQSYSAESKRDPNAREGETVTLQELRLPAFGVLPEEKIFGVKKAPTSWRLPQVVRGLEAVVDVPPFLINLQEGTILGDDLVGLSKLDVLDSKGNLLHSVPAHFILGVAPQGVLFKAFTPHGAEINYLSEKGEVIPLAGKAAVTYRMPFPAPPFPNVTVTQSGQSYSPSCGIFDHTSGSSMAYAYDIFAPLSSPYVLASGAGTVAYRVSNVTCNNYDAGGCSDYVSGCDGNGGWGNTVILQHADGTYTKYSHLKYNSIFPGMGASVGIGCQIATQGHTGATFSSSTSNPCGDHLHFQRQTSSLRYGTSTAIAFSDATNPLTCKSYATGNTGLSCVF